LSRFDALAAAIICRPLSDASHFLMLNTPPAPIASHFFDIDITLTLRYTITRIISMPLFSSIR
jgi:hypothetical protein